MSQTPMTGRPTITRRSFLGVTTAALGVGLLSSACGGSGGPADGGLDVLAFAPPSLGAFLPAIITATGIDRDHRMPLRFRYTTPDNYNTEFSAGHYQVGGSAALLSEALRRERDLDVTYLFNLFDYFTAVVTSDPGIRSLRNIAGRRLAAATGTTNHAMFTWFAARQGLDLDDVELTNQTPAGLSTIALLGKSDATEIWEPAYTSLVKRKPDIRTIDIGLSEWSRRFSTDVIPYLGLAASTQWALANPDRVRSLYAIYRDAAAFVADHPPEASKIIAAASPGGRPATLQQLIETPGRLKLHVAPASELTGSIDAVFRAGQETGYLTDQPPATIVYRGLT